LPIYPGKFWGIFGNAKSPALEIAGNARLLGGLIFALVILVLVEGEMDAKSVDERIVLVVDDDPGIRENMSDLLHAKGFSVLQAENGQRALDLLKKTPQFPCLIVLDMAMPIMDGRVFLKRRAHDAALRDIPVVVVSGSSQTAPLPGIGAYFRKPVNVDRLIEVIDQHC